MPCWVLVWRIIQIVKGRSADNLLRSTDWLQDAASPVKTRDSSDSRPKVLKVPCAIPKPCKCCAYKLRDFSCNKCSKYKHPAPHGGAQRSVSPLSKDMLHHVSMCMYAYTNTQTHIHTHIHTHTYIYIDIQI